MKASLVASARAGWSLAAAAQLLVDAVVRDGLADHWSRIVRLRNQQVDESCGVGRIIGCGPRLDHQADPGLTGAPGLFATILEPNAGNRGAVCSPPRHSLPSADGQTEDTRHEEPREQLAAPTTPPGGIFYLR
jgi:hypothetical protein